MIVIRVRLQVEPEHTATLISYVAAEAARVQDMDGCLAYGLFQDTVDPQQFMLYEEWRDRLVFDGYKSSDSFKQSGAVLFPLLSSKPDSAYYESELVGP